jgi:hypothetical protein
VCTAALLRDTEKVADTRSHPDCSGCFEKDSTAPPPVAFRGGCALLRTVRGRIAPALRTMSGCYASRFSSGSRSAASRWSHPRPRRSRAGPGRCTGRTRSCGRLSRPRRRMRLGIAASISRRSARSTHRRMASCTSPGSSSTRTCCRSRTPAASSRATNPCSRRCRLAMSSRAERSSGPSNPATAPRRACTSECASTEPTFRQCFFWAASHAPSCCRRVRLRSLSQRPIRPQFDHPRQLEAREKRVIVTHY